MTPRKRAATKRIGRPPVLPTKEQVSQVTAFAEHGLSETAIAALLGVDRRWLAKYRDSHFAEAREIGRARAQLKVSAALFARIEAGDVTAAIWWEKTRLGMTEKLHTVHSDPEGKALPRPTAHVSVGIFLPSNGRDVPVEGQEIPAQFQVVSPSRAHPRDEEENV